MSFEKVKSYLSEFDLQNRMLEFEISSATVELAAQAVGCEPAHIAKSLTFIVGEKPVMIVCAGDTKIDNSKYKSHFGEKAKMLKKEISEVVAPMSATNESQLRQWPVQIKLVPVNAPYFDNCDLLIAADCTAYAYGNFHNEFIRNRVTLIGCPKLDEGDYTEKLTAIIADNTIKSVTVVRMEVPCCGGIENAVKRALQMSGKFIPWRVVVISADGRILRDM